MVVELPPFARGAGCGVRGAAHPQRRDVPHDGYTEDGGRGVVLPPTDNPSHHALRYREPVFFRELCCSPTQEEPCRRSNDDRIRGPRFSARAFSVDTRLAASPRRTNENACPGVGSHHQRPGPRLPGYRPVPFSQPASRFGGASSGWCASRQTTSRSNHATAAAQIQSSLAWFAAVSRVCLGLGRSASEAPTRTALRPRVKPCNAGINQAIPGRCRGHADARQAAYCQFGPSFGEGIRYSIPRSRVAPENPRSNASSTAQQNADKFRACARASSASAAPPAFGIAPVGVWRGMNVHPLCPLVNTHFTICDTRCNMR
jgi:hypothetical protein